MVIVTMVQLNNYSWGHELLDFHQVKKKITLVAVFLSDLILGWGKNTKLKPVEKAAWEKRY